jgi:hypothetical protein
LLTWGNSNWKGICWVDGRHALQASGAPRG